MGELVDPHPLEGCAERRTGSSPVRGTKNCLDCGKNISKHGALRCKSCAGKQSPTRIRWPSTSELLDRLKNTPYTRLALELGVSDNAIRKRIRHHPI